MLSSLNLTLKAFFCSNPVKLLKAALHGLQQQWNCGRDCYPVSSYWMAALHDLQQQWNCERDVKKHRGIAILESWQQE